MSDAIRFLMCRPEYFDVQYVINPWMEDRKSTRLNSSHVEISYAVFCLKKKKGNEVLKANKSRSGGKYKLFKDMELVKYIEEKILVDKYSPDAVIGILPEGRFKIKVCTKTIYNYIDRDLLKVKNIDLLMKVRLKPKIFFFNDTATTEIYTLSLHDALPI